ncbi:MAG: redox-regulated ATPase YchF [Candidatus Woesearchaeota archaeon]
MLIGVVGKSNVGKSTFFKASTLANVEIANYPFVTIKPNQGMGFVKMPDPAREFGKTSNPREGFVLGKWRFAPIEMIDVAGLVPGAHEGKGMGNQFLDDLRQAHALIHVIDASGMTNENGEPLATPSYNPANDVLFLEDELDYWYLGILNRGWERFARTVQQEHTHIAKALGKQLSGLGVDEEMVNKVITKLGLPVERPMEWREKDLLSIAQELRIKTKRMIIAANKIDTKSGMQNYERLVKEFPDRIILPCSAESELALKEAAKHGLIDYVPGEKDFKITDETKLSEGQRKALDFIKENVLQSSEYGTGVQAILNAAAFKLLKMIAIFPGGVGKLEDSKGNVIPDCFLMKDGSTALDFAFKLHTDFGNNFIRAIDVKTKRTVGKDHLLKDGDIVEIVSGK